MNNLIIPAQISPANLIPVNYSEPVTYINQNQIPYPIHPSFYEYWAPITEDIVPNVKPYYWISTYGRLYSTRYNKFSTCSVNGRGYNEVCLKDINHKRLFFRLHRLMMMVFCPIDNMEDYMVNHIDGDKSHNWIWNLEWCDNAHNINEAIRIGLKPPAYGERHGMSKITDSQAEEICKLLKTQKYTCKEIADIVGGNATESIVQHISSGKRSKSLYYKYGLHLREEQVCKHFTNEQIHGICEFLQDNKMTLFKSRYDMYTKALASINVIYDRNLHRSIMAKILYKKGYNKICDLYDYDYKNNK